MAAVAILSGISAGLIAFFGALLMQKSIAVALILYPAAGFAGFAAVLCFCLFSQWVRHSAIESRVPASGKAFGHQ